MPRVSPVLVFAIAGATAWCCATGSLDGGGASDGGVDSDADADSDTDADSDSDADPCPFACVSEAVCTAQEGTAHDAYSCTTDGAICCELPASDTDADTDVDADSDTDADTDVDADSDTDADTDTGGGVPCANDFQCMAAAPAIACCDNVCVNPLNNTANCGVCGNDCFATEVGNQCFLGECKCGIGGACDPPNDCCQHIAFVWACDTCY
jgi:hypothetical protein